MGIEGVIRPPPEIRAVADKTASYVAKNGRAFESRILGSGKGKTPKFAFLQPTSPFHAYYEERIKFYENGGVDEKKDDEEKTKKKEEAEEKGQEKKDKGNKEDTEEKAEEDGKKGKTTKKKNDKTEQGQKSSAAIDPIAKALLTQRGKISQARSEFEKNLEAQKQQQQKSAEGNVEDPTTKKQQQFYIPSAPPKLELVQIVAPSSLTLAQVETIQLVAQFTALDGKGGPFIGKLQHREWNNPAFAFCQPRHGHFAYFSSLVDAYRRIYDTWTATSTTTTTTTTTASTTNDIVTEVAGNVDRCLEMTAYRVEYDRDLAEQTRKQRENNEEVAEIAQIDWHDFVVVETIDFPKDEKVELAMLPPPPPPPSSSTGTGAAGAITTPSAAAAGGTDEMEESDDDDDGGETIRVVPSYQPKVVSAQDTNNLKEVIDPITGKVVPVKDMPEHMRIQLLDPKWAEERKKFQEKQKDSNLVSGDVIASNISRFSRDAYGKSGHDLLSGETDSKKRLEEANRIIREQGQRGVGPSLPPPVRPAGAAGLPPPPPPPLPMHQQLQQRPPAEGEPATKRQRIDEVPTTTNHIATAAAGGPPLAPTTTKLETDPVAKPAPPATDVGGPPANPMLGGPMPPAEPEKKDEVLPAEEFVKTLSKPEVTLQVRIPNDPAQMAWNFYGQIVSVSVDVMSKVKAVKQEIARVHLNGMPANKIQLKSSSTGFLKDNVTLAFLNIGPTATLDMIPKTRGGRR